MLVSLATPPYHHVVPASHDTASWRAESAIGCPLPQQTSHKHQLSRRGKEFALIVVDNKIITPESQTKLQSNTLILGWYFSSSQFHQHILGAQLPVYSGPS